MFLIPGIILIILIITYECIYSNAHELLLYRFFAQLISLNIVFQKWPGFLYISDGGHIENFGLLPLIRRKCRLIIISDGSHDPNETCEPLMETLIMAEERLYCSFFSKDINQSVTHQLKTEFIGNENRSRFINFRVRYDDGTFGEIIYLKAKIDANKKWNGVCCDCCKSCSFWECCFGQFPYHSTGHQFFSPGLYNLYQKEGIEAYEEYKQYKNE